MTKNRPKKQHYVPQLHLRHFVGSDPDGMVWTYDKREGTARPSPPKETAVETNFYSVVGENGKYVDAIEEWLAGVESTAAPIYERLLYGEIPRGQQRADFSVFLASLFARTPAMRRAFGEVIGKQAQILVQMTAETPERFERELKKFEAETRPIDPRIRAGLRDFIRDKSRYKVQVDRARTLKALELSDKLQEIMFRMGWVVIASSGDDFITSDHPVVRISPTESYHPLLGDGGFLNREALVSIPLSPRYCLLMRWSEDGGSRVVPIGKSDVRILNRQRAAFSERYLFAKRRDEGLIRLAYKYREHKISMRLISDYDLAEVEVVRNLARKSRENSRAD